jgi:hypothetical protein
MRGIEEEIRSAFSPPEEGSLIDINDLTMESDIVLLALGCDLPVMSI